MHSFQLGDSAAPDQRHKYSRFFSRLSALANLEEPWTLVLRWPLAPLHLSPPRRRCCRPCLPVSRCRCAVSHGSSELH